MADRQDNGSLMAMPDIGALQTWRRRASGRTQGFGGGEEAGTERRPSVVAKRGGGGFEAAK